MSNPERRLRDGLRPCLWTFLGTRLGLFVISAVGVNLIAPRPGVSVPGWVATPITSGWHNVVTALTREDALWFLRIATDGYSKGDGSAAFFPLYPLLVRIVSWLLGGHPLLGSLLVSNGAFFLALLVLFDLTAREYSKDIACKTVVYIAIFPTAFFFFAPYSESLFLLWSVLAFWFARRDRWAMAALAGALAALTRSIGIVIAPALALMAIEQWRASQRALAPRLAASAGVLLGPLAYFAWWQWAHDELLAPVHAQARWDRVVAWPLATMWHALADARHVGGSNNGYWMIDVVVVGVVLLAVIVGFRRLALPYLLYAAGSLLIPLSYPFPPRPLLSMPRFVVVIFPAFWVMADAAQRRRIPHTAIVASFAAGFALLSVLFVNWWYIF